MIPLQRAALKVLRDMANSSSFLQPFWRSMPRGSELPLNKYRIPVEYVHLLQSDKLVSAPMSALIVTCIGSFLRCMLEDVFLAIWPW